MTRVSRCSKTARGPLPRGVSAVGAALEGDRRQGCQSAEAGLERLFVEFGAIHADIRGVNLDPFAFDESPGLAGDPAGRDAFPISEFRFHTHNMGLWTAECTPTSSTGRWLAGPRVRARCFAARSAPYWRSAADRRGMARFRQRSPSASRAH